ncbi:hypothetical protein HKX48_007176 [Thoreauomyces humboldtii]|nr:hypothetical protein HKX48_007176 [Thoreauomyces humboldtii]
MATFAKATFDAAGYALSRPVYTPKLYSSILAYHKGGTSLALDVGAGSCQVAKDLANKFERVEATDPSIVMVTGIKDLPSNVTISKANAENLLTSSATADLLVAGQAAHWFDLPRFAHEAQRVLRPDGTVAVWSYTFIRFPTKPNLTARFHALANASDQLGPYWEAGRKIVDQGYPDFANQFQRAGFKDVETWKAPEDLVLIDKEFGGVDAFRQYVKTWSAYSNYMDKHPDREDPVDRFIEKAVKDGEISAEEAEKGWPVEWPGVVIIGRK